MRYVLAAMWRLLTGLVGSPCPGQSFVVRRGDDEARRGAALRVTALTDWIWDTKGSVRGAVAQGDTAAQRKAAQFGVERR